jgi:hypothetical protein
MTELIKELTDWKIEKIIGKYDFDAKYKETFLKHINDLYISNKPSKLKVGRNISEDEPFYFEEILEKFNKKRHPENRENEEIIKNDDPQNEKNIKLLTIEHIVFLYDRELSPEKMLNKITIDNRELQTMDDIFEYLQFLFHDDKHILNQFMLYIAIIALGKAGEEMIQNFGRHRIENINLPYISNVDSLFSSTAEIKQLQNLHRKIKNKFLVKYYFKNAKEFFQGKMNVKIDEKKKSMIIEKKGFLYIFDQNQDLEKRIIAFIECNEIYDTEKDSFRCFVKWRWMIDDDEIKNVIYGPENNLTAQENMIRPENNVTFYSKTMDKVYDRINNNPLSLGVGASLALGLVMGVAMVGGGRKTKRRRKKTRKNKNKRKTVKYIGYL